MAEKQAEELRKKAEQMDREAAEASALRETRLRLQPGDTVRVPKFDKLGKVELFAGEPPERLIGWARVDLAAGESKRVTVPVSHDHLTIYDESGDSWKFVFGQYVIRVGGSSQDLPLQETVSYKKLTVESQLPPFARGNFVNQEQTARHSVDSLALHRPPSAGACGNWSPHWARHC